MATMTITIPDEHLSRVLNAFDAEYPHDDEITSAQNAKNTLVSYIKGVIKKAERKAAIEAISQITVDNSVVSIE